MCRIWRYASSTDGRIDHGHLPQRGVVHYGAVKDRAISPVNRICYLVRRRSPSLDWPPQMAVLAASRKRRGALVQVFVRDNNVDQALRVLKKKMQREGVFREMRLRRHYGKPSERRAREKTEAIRRARKVARKKLQREGLLPMKPKVLPRGPGRRGPAR